MVKATPKLRTNNLARRRKKFMELYNTKQREALFLHFNPNSSSTTTTKTPNNPDFTPLSPSSDLHLQQQSTPDSDLKHHESPLTPPLSSNKKRRSRSPNSIYATTTNTTTTTSSPSLFSSPPLFNSNSPLQDHQFLKRTVSNPTMVFPDLSNEDNSNSKKTRRIYQDLNQSSIVSRNLMGQLLPPLPPYPSQKLLRRTVSEPVHLLSQNISITKEKNEKEEKKEQIVKAEKLSGDWTMIKFKCGCGSDLKFIFSAAENKCYKLV